MNDGDRRTALPVLASRLGYAGLLPQIAALGMLLLHDPYWHFAALALAYAYAAIILSFLGGLWWGVAARTASEPPAWIWAAAVTPSLVCLASAVPWAIGDTWPGPSLYLLGIGLIAALAVDYRLQAQGLAPPGWLRLRVPLSLGLGLLTLAIATF